jgi:phospho-N-acetylmuramoyl-pentapeptide-transferase
MTVSLTLSFIIAFFVSSGLGAFLVPWLRRIKAGQMIREDGPTWHMSKSGTPTMGGLMFIAACTVVCLTVGYGPMLNGDYGHLFILAFALIFGAIGFLDDLEKLKKKKNLGLTAKTKFLLQLVAAIAFTYLLRCFGYVTPNLYIPFWNISVQMPESLYFIFCAFAVVSTVNAVNLTDGVDGLASGTSIPVCLFFGAVTFLWGEQYTTLGIFASALAGGLLGFLVYNYNPAKVFMGDTGSLFLGGAIVGMALMTNMPLIILVLGLLFVVEALSDVIQVAYFKFSHGKRVFKMAPFHHHLEMGGWSGKKWSEKQLFTLYTGISLACAIISFIGIYNRYAF